MKVSVFGENNYIIGIDYSKKKTCKNVFDLTIDEIEKLKNGCKLNIVNNGYEIIETNIYNQYINNVLIEKAYKKFNETLRVINAKYTEDEQKTFEIKRQEAIKVLNGEESEFINALCVEGETTEDLANLIMANSQAYQLLYAQAEKELRETLKTIGE